MGAGTMKFHEHIERVSHVSKEIAKLQQQLTTTSTSGDKDPSLTSQHHPAISSSTGRIIHPQAYKTHSHTQSLPTTSLTQDNITTSSRSHIPGSAGEGAGGVSGDIHISSSSKAEDKQRRKEAKKESKKKDKKEHKHGHHKDHHKHDHHDDRDSSGHKSHKQHKHSKGDKERSHNSDRDRRDTE